MDSDPGACGMVRRTGMDRSYHRFGTASDSHPVRYLWSPLFFNLKRPDWALIEVPFLWLSIVALMIGVAPFSTLAVWLLLPYLLWVTFAAFLNLTIVRMNRSFGRVERSRT